MRHTVIDSPLGPLTLVADGDTLTGLYYPGHRPAPRADRLGEACGPDGFADAIRELGEYFAGRRREFDLTVCEDGTPFQREVWAVLRTVPYGSTVTYGEIAARVGRPGAARAVGAAVGRNPVSIVVPCHRVVGGGGAITGYAGGVARKQQLLDLERG